MTEASAPATVEQAGNGDCEWRRLAVSPDLLDVHRSNPERYPFLLESVARGSERARYDILFAFPGERLALAASGALARDGANLIGNDFLDHLDGGLTLERAPSPLPPVPFYGGWFVYLGYELVSQTEPSVALPRDDGAHSIAEAHRVPAAIVRDHARGDTVLVAETPQRHLIEEMHRDLRRPPRLHAGTLPAFEDAPGGLEEDPPQAYLDGVERVKRYIRDGDVFQVNLSRAWRARLRQGIEPADVYARLRASNPAPFAGLVRLPGRSVASSSPERLVRIAGGRAETRPIAGTYPRDADATEDRALSAALLAHPKERAEHIMLIDLERNDLGRVCQTGSIEVNELMALESYTHVHHIVSNVRGRLRADVTPGQVIRAVFPGGTITGCPKVRCMEIIAELENVPRGPYTGAFAYFNNDGSGDSNILIRTIDLVGDRVQVRAGAGIVADSDPRRELDETRQKARGPLTALVGLLE